MEKNKNIFSGLESLSNAAYAKYLGEFSSNIDIPLKKFTEKQNSKSWSSQNSINTSDITLKFGKKLPCKNYKFTNFCGSTNGLNFYNKKRKFLINNNLSQEINRKLRKNDREKQRRTELNEKFLQLENELSFNKGIKKEKIFILTEAIFQLNFLRQENAYLRSELFKYNYLDMAKNAKTNVKNDDNSIHSRPIKNFSRNHSNFVNFENAKIIKIGNENVINNDITKNSESYYNIKLKESNTHRKLQSSLADYNFTKCEKYPNFSINNPEYLNLDYLSKNKDSYLPNKIKCNEYKIDKDIDKNCINMNFKNHKETKTIYDFNEAKNCDLKCTPLKQNKLVKNDFDKDKKISLKIC